MSFEMSLANKSISDAIEFISQFLEARSQKGSDPGLCVAPLNEDLDKDRLIAYGKAAKKEVLTKQSAYDLAKDLDIHLTEHGGTGQGVVGALAGVGLRLSGNDGRYRGWYHLGLPGEVISLKQLYRYDFVEDLVTVCGETISGQTHVHIGSERTKTVRINGRQVIVLMKNNINGSGHGYRTMTKNEAKLY